MGERSERRRAGGTNGTLLHFDGNSWTPVASHTINHIDGIWGSSANRVWAVAGGIGGAGAANLIYWNGSAWAPVAGATPDNLSAIWGSSADNVWAAGGSGVEGVIVHYDGHAWATELTSDAVSLKALSGSSASDLWAGGENIYPNFSPETLLQGSQATWTPFAASNGDQQIYGMWVASAVDAWSVGNVMMHWDGQTWSPVSSSISSQLKDLNAIWGADANHVTAVGRKATIAEWDGMHWSIACSGGASLNAVGGSDLQHRWAVGDNGTIFRYEPDVSGTLTCQDVQGQCTAVSACAVGQGHLSDYSCGGADVVCCVAQAACGGDEPKCCLPNGARERPFCDGGDWTCAGNSSPCLQPPAG